MRRVLGMSDVGFLTERKWDLGFLTEGKSDLGLDLVTITVLSTNSLKCFFYYDKCIQFKSAMFVTE